MIRINLLPVKRDRKKEAGRNHLIVGVLVLLVEAGVLMALSMDMDNKIAQQRNVNASVDAQIQRIQQKIAGHDQILKEIQEYEKRQQAIEELQAARSGPVQAMLEISRILSKGGKPTIPDDEYREIIKLNPSKGYDDNWDYRRVWLESFDEKDKHVTIKGFGVTHEDVAEFLRRLSLSSFFVASELVSTSLVKPNVPMAGARIEAADDVVAFVVVGEVRYK